MLREWSIFLWFLHGVAGSRATYSWLPESVAGHRVIRPDFRGHGAAARTPGAYRISDYVADVIEVLRAEGPAVLVGHSLGGVAAWSAAQRAPELVRGAFLEDPPLYLGEPEGHARTRPSRTSGDLLSLVARLAGRRRLRGRRPRRAWRRSPTGTCRPPTRWRPAPTRCCISIPRCWTRVHRRLAAGRDRRRRAGRRPGLRAGRGVRAGVRRRPRGAARDVASPRAGRARRGRGPLHPRRARVPGRVLLARRGVRRVSVDGGPRRITASTSSTLPRHHPSFSMYHVRSV